MMNLNPSEAARKVLIAYRQLSEIVKDSIVLVSAKSHCERYDQILVTLGECFTFDDDLTQSVSLLRPLHPSTINLVYHMESDGRKLLAMARSFIESYLPPEDKRDAKSGL
jgi:hypothetical protein